MYILIVDSRWRLCAYQAERGLTGVIQDLNQCFIMNIIDASPIFSGFSAAPITAIERGLSRLRNWKEEVVTLVGRCVIFFVRLVNTDAGCRRRREAIG